MFEVTIDGRFYSRHDTVEAAEAARANLRRWSSCSTRIEVAAVAAEPVALAAPTPCAGCGGTGTATRLQWVGARGGWVHGPGACRSCGGSGVHGQEAPAATAA